MHAAVERVIRSLNAKSPVRDAAPGARGADAPDGAQQQAAQLLQNFGRQLAERSMTTGAQHG